MKYSLLLAILINMNLIAATNCQSIQITDSCTETGSGFSKLFSYHFEMSFICEKEDNKDYKKTVEFKSLRAEMDCLKFENTITKNKMSVDQLDALIAYSSPFSKAKIKTIGSDIPSTEETTKARMNWMRSVANSKNKKAPSTSEAMKLRKQ